MTNAASVPREEYERVVAQRDKLTERLLADPDRFAIAAEMLAYIDSQLRRL